MTNLLAHPHWVASRILQSVPWWCIQSHHLHVKGQLESCHEIWLAPDTSLTRWCDVRTLAHRAGLYFGVATGSGGMELNLVVLGADQVGDCICIWYNTYVHLHRNREVNKQAHSELTLSATCLVELIPAHMHALLNTTTAVCLQSVSKRYNWVPCPTVSKANALTRLCHHQ